MSKKVLFQFIAILLVTSIYSQQSKVVIDGELKKWHKVTLSFTGEQLSENDAENPFLNYRLNVTFNNGDKTFLVPGFFAADGNASETSAVEGNVWKVRFRPNKIGKWTYKVSFKKGKQIAVDNNSNEGESVLFDGFEGSFSIEDTDKTGADFRAKGRLNYIGKRYLQFEDSKEYFLKGGADSPENFLGYVDFDQTPASHKYLAHYKDWKQGDPTWQNGKGKNMIGALNYLASKGMNSVYFLTMNVQGDGKDVWPWIDINERYRFDCSKLDQWEIVFDHMEKLGLMMHIVTQETENELLLDIGELGVQRKLYYRELIARFSHHLAITWNLGEENGAVHWSPKGQSNKDREAMAEYLKKNDPYKNYVALHTHSIIKEQNLYLEPLLGFEFLDGPSMQTHEPNEIHEITKRWISDSQKTGRNWVVCQDEIGPADTGAKPDADDPEHNSIRAKVLWGNLMAGGAGVEWYFGYKYAHNDLNCEDWRSRDKLWEQTKIALDFFQNYLPFSEMKSADDLTSNPNDYVFAQNGKVYTVYMPEAQETKINLFGTNNSFNIKWYNPKKGGKLIKGTVKSVKGGDMVSIGFPPIMEGDWVALITAKGETSLKEQLKTVKPFIEKDGFLKVEAEAFHYKTNNGTKRNWILKTVKNVDGNSVVINSASEKSYIEAYPDTRITHDDPLIIGENFFPIAGVGGIVSFKVKIENPGKYYVWTKAFSTGTEDNGLHVGIDEQWPESGQRIQLCDGKNKWTWSSAQRVEENHCGVPQTIYLEFKEAGTYIISFSMREDGFKFDQWILTKNRNFIPQ
ncbi:Putative collagen-binding domain of a collagenase [Lutibacter oricola]|uniref:Putative collagen-binding domain of a collagenase n=1 Tax=Lutibacter oricola TaxID=762486 RepID=A0A1H2VNY8_9FLAO|nr:DUF5060 domain-containing protein [Lutibacter oricola]SDW70031.1 Putative collagen-binding domain of a collagenase [Lutibacter oricola]